MKKIVILISVIGLFIFNACEPRIDMDMAQWGVNASLTNVQIFKFEVDDNPSLYETRNNIGEISGYRRIIISKRAVIDEDNSTATIALKGNETLNEAGFIFYHRSIKIAPIDDAPRGGMIGDLTGRILKYKLYSADGTTRDWTIIIE